MYGAGIEEPYRFTIFDFSVSSIKAIKGTPLTKERETENGEVFTDSYYPGCKITVDQIHLLSGEDEAGSRKGVLYSYLLHVSKIS